MSKVPRVSGSDAVKAFEKAGFHVERWNGSHAIMKKSGCRYALSIPCHAGKTLGVGLLKKQIKLAGLTIEEFSKHC